MPHLKLGGIGSSELSGQEEGRVSDTFVGFYWTLPVNWADFRSLPPDPTAAASASRTIRYQRERVRRHVAEVAGLLLDEIVFMDTRPDRATAAVHEALARGAWACRGERATLLHVEFAQVHLWRRNPHLARYAEEQDIEVVSLPPIPLTIDARLFDPIEHFADWRERDAQAMTGLRVAAHEGLQAALAEVPEGAGRWQSVADKLNERGIRTIRGGRWTAENVRKLAGRVATPV